MDLSSGEEVILTTYVVLEEDIGDRFLGMSFETKKGKMATIGCIETILQGILSSTVTSLGEGTVLSLVELAMSCI
jgi:hypothetical protein